MIVSTPDFPIPTHQPTHIPINFPQLHGFCFIFETGFLCVVLVVLELTL